jgi:hypothetical protein
MNTLREQILRVIADAGEPMTVAQVFDCLTGYDDKKAVTTSVSWLKANGKLRIAGQGELGGNGKPMTLYEITDYGKSFLEKKDEPEPECCGHCASHVMPQEEDPVISAMQHKREPIRFAKSHAARLRALAKEEPREIVADWLNVLADELWSGQ